MPKNVGCDTYPRQLNKLNHSGGPTKCRAPVPKKKLISSDLPGNTIV